MPTIRAAHQRPRPEGGITRRSGYFEKSGGLLRPGAPARLKYQLMEQEKANFPITMMAGLLGVARAGFYAWRKAGRPVPKAEAPPPVPRGAAGRTKPDPSAPRPPAAAPGAAWPLVRAWLKEWVLWVWHTSKGRYGARRIKAALAAEPGAGVSLWLVGRLMRELGVAGVQPNASKRTTVADPDAPKRPDLVGRRFNPPVPGTFLVGDITYIKTGEGWAYLATVIDLTTRMVIGWRVADHMRASLVVEALEMARASGRAAGGAVFHSDRGAQYTSSEFAAAARRLDM
ncbi:MAG: IS3 family transposase, partial [Bifidobacteriaceae bacterium]|nr:IS3 family transposase [Bifidobacteriaceae bacterium]